MGLQNTIQKLGSPWAVIESMVGTFVDQGQRRKDPGRKLRPALKSVRRGAGTRISSFWRFWTQQSADGDIEENLYDRKMNSIRLSLDSRMVGGRTEITWERRSLTSCPKMIFKEVAWMLGCESWPSATKMSRALLRQSG